ncbi:MAG: hypothetical protein JF586_05415 [Burkholderiales bacterium]|jgi:hypothetical protein|nr:hypothetical protein [Burkholderiales bacterium]
MDLIPLSKHELDARLRSSQTVAIAAGIVGLGFLSAGLFVDLVWLSFAGGIILIVLYMARCNGLSPAFSGESKPLAGECCERLREIALEHEPVMNFVRAINRQGRPVAWADLWQVNDWLCHQEVLKHMRACRFVNEVDSAVA